MRSCLDILSFQEASFEYMEKESEIQLLEALDQLEVAFSESVRTGFM